ncbi:hypothetical protein INR49_011876 [Caranx melampygus]|nr:hypothetical protein INR49_011876 [Caranx melampygus]
MSHSGGGHSAGARPSVVPCFSTRTLQHPSFLPLYMAAGFAHHHTGSTNQTGESLNYHICVKASSSCATSLSSFPSVQHIIPAEVFYTDPTMGRGRRIPNMLSDLGLNTPPPVMSACLAPPNRPDPFRSGPHPIRNLGCPAWTTTPTYSPVQPSRAVVQLTQEEDQAVTNLLKLHHQEPRQSGETLTAAQGDGDAGPPGDLNPCIFRSHSKPTFPTSAEEVHKGVCGDFTHPNKAGSGDHLQQGRCWSHVELEAADTLLSGFRIWDQCHGKSAEMLPDPPPDQHNKDLPVSTNNQQEPGAEPSLKASLSDIDISHIRLTCVGENGGQVHREEAPSGHFPEATLATLSCSRNESVQVEHVSPPHVLVGDLDDVDYGEPALLSVRQAAPLIPTWEREKEMWERRGEERRGEVR